MRRDQHAPEFPCPFPFPLHVPLQTGQEYLTRVAEDDDAHRDRAGPHEALHICQSVCPGSDPRGPVLHVQQTVEDDHQVYRHVNHSIPEAEETHVTEVLKERVWK